LEHDAAGPTTRRVHGQVNQKPLRLWQRSAAGRNGEHIKGFSAIIGIVPHSGGATFQSRVLACEFGILGVAGASGGCSPDHSGSPVRIDATNGMVNIAAGRANQTELGQGSPG
jgi:hypothetical protein